MKNALGRHLLVEFYNCDAVVLNEVRTVEKIMNQAADACGATIIESIFHRFEPHGVSGVVVIAESHLAIHTWPEYSYASVDLFTCGDTIEPMAAYSVLKNKLRATTAEIQKFNRGNLDFIRRRMKLGEISSCYPATASVNYEEKALLKKGGSAKI